MKGMIEMKTKRVLLISVLFLVILVSLTGCIIIPTYKQYDIDAETVSSVEIYDLRNSDTHYSDFLASQTPVYTVEQDQTSDFLSDLSGIRFSDAIIIAIAAIDPSFVYDDWVVRINYTDGSYSLISCDGYGETYDANDQVIETNHFGCEDDEWKQLIGKYVPKDIFESEEQDQ